MRHIFARKNIPRENKSTHNIMETRENAFTVGGDGSLHFTYQGREMVLTEQMLRTMQDTSREKVKCTDELQRLHAALEQADKNDPLVNDIIRREIDVINKHMEDTYKAQKDRLDSMGRPSTETANKLDNEILTPVAAFFEAFLKQRQRAKAIFSDAVMDRLSEDFMEAFKAKNGTKMIECMRNAGAEIKMLEAPQESDAMKLLAVRGKDGEWQTYTFQNPAEWHEFKNDPASKQRLDGAIEARAYSLSREEFLKNMNRLMSSKDKPSFIESLISAKMLGSRTAGEESIKPWRIQKMDDRNALARLRLLSFAKKENAQAISDTDFSEAVKRGIDISIMPPEMAETLANGGVTPLIPTIRREKNGKVVKGECRLRIFKTEKGYSLAVFDKCKTAQIPDKIGDHELRPEEKKALMEKGRLKNAIKIHSEGRAMLVLPYLDRETNHVFTRNMDKVLVPENYKGVEIIKEKSVKLIHGETVHMSGLLDKQGQRYSGYVRINPLNGKIEEYVRPSEMYRLQVAANNFGERTDDLAKDKDSVLKSAQRHNDDPVETTTKKIDKDSKIATKLAQKHTGFHMR